MMKCLWFLLLLTAVSSRVTAQANMTSILQEAESRYAAGDWAGAAAAFEQALSLGAADPALYINLGHSYAGQSRPGEALLNYRRAQALVPRDPEVLGFIASIIADRRDQSIPAETPLDSLYYLTADLMTADELSALNLLLWTFTFGLWAACQIARFGPRLRSSLRLAASALTVILIPMLLLLGVRLFIESQRPAAVVIADQTQARSGPSEAYMDLYPVYAAAEVRVLQQRDGWALVELGEGRLAWLPAEAFRLVRTPD
jgi:tetratricopeptide (TPR) repeat protein